MTVNKVELIGTYGSDLIHGLSAWTSTSRDLTEAKKARVGNLLKMLAKDSHHTPFEKSMLHFLVTTDIATHIHLLKHRVGVSINGESARYRELKDKYYLPVDWKAGEADLLKEHIEGSFKKYHECLDRLVADGYTRARAKESARFYLPYGTQITADISFNWRSFAHFQKLRNDEHAQKEVRDVARAMLELVEQLDTFPLTISSMREAGFL